VALNLRLREESFVSLLGGVNHNAPLLGWDAAVILNNGWIGVDLFFVLSGFLITNHILKAQEKAGQNWSWKPYLTKRALRIIPAYYAVLFMAVAGGFPFYDISPYLIEFKTIYHVLFLQDYLPANIVVAFWSLGVEEKFYIIAPVLIVMVRKMGSIHRQVLAIIILIIIGVLLRVLTAFDNPGVAEYNSFFFTFRSPFHLTLVPILIGVLLAFIYHNRKELPWLTSAYIANCVFWLGTVIFILLITTTALMDSISLWDKTLQPTLIAVACGCITFGVLFGDCARPFFRSLTLFFFARISYSLYLIHLPLIPLSIELSNIVASQQDGFFVFCGIFLSVSIIAALLLHYVVEKPFLLIKDRVRL